MFIEFCNVKCNGCNVDVSLQISYLLQKKNHAGQKELREELARHNHPKTRKINNNGVVRQRNRAEEARELADHYILHHGVEEPIFD